ncbi:TPA: hypothetical protein N0F65_006548 [Lagenidium giganteum]|uniref:Ribosomal protein L2 n=1 Tax=Lagenidium giganteum TaxID=4803 RepID=A0AAV2YMG4_9STRA|nr:TPA: hypothetical protein N0F65_006548 [Lagenidium giganteum]
MFSAIRLGQRGMAKSQTHGRASHEPRALP